MIRRVGILIFSFLLSVNLSAAQSAPSGEEMNLMDANGKKTGFWMVTGAVRPTKGYRADQLIEEGNYVANKKEGLWKKYYPNGKLLSEIEYIKNIPNGRYKTYYPSGQLEEEGNWKMSRNTGDFKRFHPNGKVSQQFTFADSGKRTGVQKYFHENGALELEVSVENGQENGDMKRYYANGDIKEIKTFTNGKMNEGSQKTFAEKKPTVVVEETLAVPVKVTKVVKEDKPNISVFKATGNNTLYNKNRMISQTGYFKNGKLYDGKWYKYTKDGILDAIEIYKKGKFIGHAVIDETDR